MRVIIVGTTKILILLIIGINNFTQLFVPLLFFSIINFYFSHHYHIKFFLFYFSCFIIFPSFNFCYSINFIDYEFIFALMFNNF